MCLPRQPTRIRPWHLLLVLRVLVSSPDSTTLHKVSDCARFSPCKPLMAAPENPVSPRFGINHPKVATRRFRDERFHVGPIPDIALNLTSHHDRGVAMLFRFLLAARDHAVKRRKR